MPSLTELDFSQSSIESAEPATPRTISALNGGVPHVPPNPIPPWPPQPQSELVQAVNVVARAVTARIGTLQAEIDALRRALQPFQHLGKQNQDVFTQASGDDAVSELLAIARKLGGSSAGQS